MVLGDAAELLADGLGVLEIMMLADQGIPLALEERARYGHPALRIKKVQVRPKTPRLPTHAPTCT